MKTTRLMLSIMILNIGCIAQQRDKKTITKNNMEVSWYFSDGRIFFEMSAPTDGWVTIGFNTHSGTKGTYLLMGNVISGKPNVVEHYTISPGNYTSITSLGETSQTEDIAGNKKFNRTTLTFSLPVKPCSKYQRDLSVGKAYVMLIAYSQEDDFQHHSMMRTSIHVTL